MPMLFEVNQRLYNRKLSILFNIYLEAQIQAKYLNIQKRLTRFVMRTRYQEEQGTQDCPPYIFTKEQEVLYKRLLTCVYKALSEIKLVGYQREQADNKAKEALINFLLSLFNYTLDTNKYKSAILSSLIAIGIQVTDNIIGYKQLSLDEYLVNYLAVIKVIRLLIIHQATINKEELEAKHGQQLGEDIIKFKLCLFYLVRERVRYYACETSETTLLTPFNQILETRSYGIKVQFTSTGGTSMVQRGDQVSLRNITIIVLRVIGQ